MICSALSRCVAIVLAGAAVMPAALSWKLQYFYDEERSTLNIVDLKFASAQRGIAVGEITTEKQKPKPVVLVTADAGAHWTSEPLKEHPLSLFLLNESLGWMVTERGIWATEEAGRNWHKLPKTPSGIVRVWFLDEQRGFAVGTLKSVWETRDGAKSWHKVEAAQEPKTNPKFTVYDAIAFVTPQRGMIAGWSRPPRRDDVRLPDWIDPEKAERQREWPHLSISLDTVDGGKVWKPSVASVFGRISRIALGVGGPSLGLLDFGNGFAYSSEVFRFDWHTGASKSVFREKNRLVTDIAVLPSGKGFVASVEVPGTLQRSPIPTRVRMYQSDDLVKWIPMQADYRASATRVTLAPAPGGEVYIATDTGMILRLAAN